MGHMPSPVTFIWPRRPWVACSGSGVEETPPIQPAMAASPALTLKPGDPAPDFTATATDGSTVRLADFAGRYVVLYFYPRDNTPGCTTEACSFRDAHAGFTKRKAVVLGVSTDDAASHRKFQEKFHLPFTLLTDTDQALVNAFGVWGDKVFMGRKFKGTHRVTFLIGPDGRIRHVWPKVKAEGHADEVLTVLDSLAKG